MRFWLGISLLLVVLGSLAALFAQAPGQQQQPEFVKQGQQLIREGKPEEALALLREEEAVLIEFELAAAIKV